MPIIRSKHSFDEQFTQIPNAWLRDSRLSLKAKGLLGQIMTHTPGWSLSVASLAQANNCGRDSIRAAIAELEQAGYLTREQNRVNGQFSDMVWATSEPHGLDEEPLSDSPSSEKPSSVNPTTKNTNLKEHQNKETPSTAVEDEFSEFWKHYPRKVERIDAASAFAKAFRQYGRVIIDGAKAMANDPNLPPKQYIPYPASWIRAGGWENEPYPPRQKTKDELLAEEQERIRRRDEAERERRERAREEARREEEEFIPPPRCIHNRIQVRCPSCAPDLTEADN